MYDYCCQQQQQQRRRRTKTKKAVYTIAQDTKQQQKEQQQEQQQQFIIQSLWLPTSSKSNKSNMILHNNFHMLLLLSLLFFLLSNCTKMTTSFTIVPTKNVVHVVSPRRRIVRTTRSLWSSSSSSSSSPLYYIHPLKRKRSSATTSSSSSLIVVYSSFSSSLSISINDESTILSLSSTSESENNAKLMESIDDSNRIKNARNDQDVQDESKLLLQQTLLEWFQGDFDNYNQVVNDRNNGLVPKEGGGHEHIHCTLVPVQLTNQQKSKSNSNNNKVIAARLAAFYFDGIPTAVFRFRYYQLIIVDVDTDTDTDTDDIANDSSTNTKTVVIDTILYTLHPELEKLLRQQSNNPTVWASIFNSFPTTTTKATRVLDDCSTSNNDSKIYDYVETNNNIDNDNRIRLLPKCDVRWSFTIDPIQHSYAIEYNGKQQQQQQQQRSSSSSSSLSVLHTNETQNLLNNGIHAVMVYGNATIDSQMLPGSKIFILDQLSLWSNQLWIHDRGFDVHTMKYIYGNQNNIPYILHRVSNFIITTTTTNTTSTNNVTSILSNIEQEKEQQQQQYLYQREIINNDLQWTLGTEYRTEELYKEKLYAMGGPSINIPPSLRKPTTASTGASTNTGTGTSIS